jgi:hypothetical protein
MFYNNINFHKKILLHTKKIRLQTRKSAWEGIFHDDCDRSPTTKEMLLSGMRVYLKFGRNLMQLRMDWKFMILISEHNEERQEFHHRFYSVKEDYKMC